MNHDKHEFKNFRKSFKYNKRKESYNYNCGLKFHETISDVGSAFTELSLNDHILNIGGRMRFTGEDTYYKESINDSGYKKGKIDYNFSPYSYSSILKYK